jgi:hypothetical protein
MLMKANTILLFAFVALMLPVANASYTITHLNVTVNLNANASADVSEVFTVDLSNVSVGQYSTNRVALNLTLADWQTLIGPSLVQHIINPGYSIYDFKFLPGPVIKTGGQDMAYILMSYTVNNVTVMNQTAPRDFVYTFVPKVLNFEQGASGEVLTPNTTLTIDLPQGAVIKSIPYPLPDYPPSAFTTSYANTTSVSWFYGEPLSKFTLTFVITEGIQKEVTSFFAGIYRALGAFTYVVIAAVVLGFIIYAYLRTGR